MSIQPPLSELPIKTADSGFYRGFSVNVTVISKIIRRSLRDRLFGPCDLARSGPP